METEQKKTLKQIWQEKLWLRVTAAILACAMLFGLAGHGIYLYHINRIHEQQELEILQLETVRQQEEQAYQNAFTLAGDAAAAGDYQAAAAQLDICLSLTEPGSDRQAELLTTRASLYILLGENDLALEDLKKAAELNPDSSDALLLKSQTELGSGDYEGALRDMEAYLEKDPENYQIRLSMTQLYEALEQYDKASKSYAKLLELRPGDTDLQLNAARAGILAGNSKEAAAVLTELISLQPSGDACFLLALAYLQQEDIQSSYDAFSQALDQGYDPAICLDEMISCSFVLGDYSQALEDFGAYLLRFPEGPEMGEIWQQAGVSAMLLEDYDLGRDYLDQAIARLPEDPVSHYYRGLCSFSQEQWQAAAEDFTCALEAGYLPQNSSYNRGLCYAQLLDYDKAIIDLERTVTYDGDPELQKSARELIPGLKEANSGK